MMPNFFIIGAPKCGTTSLAEIIDSHPDGFVCKPKEPRYFSHDEFYKLGNDWYEGLFSEAGDKKAIGDASTSYATSLTDEKSAERISATTPAAKLIYCVRNPLKRIESVWMEHHFAKASAGRDFSSGMVTSDFCHDVRANPGFVETSCYWTRLSVYRKLFSDDQILIVFLEERKTDPSAVLNRVMRFLDLDPELVSESQDHESHVSTTRKYPNKLGALALRVPGYRRAVRRLPRNMRQIIEMATLSTFERRPKWSQELRSEVSKRLKSEATRILQYAGKSEDFWGL